ncbi:3-phosphoglycerate kinase [Pseudomonas cavernicola]|uniref:3-phosphoglycerate kinase n=1 Tax=Pseudomonas cavernicola TaxID=2320866 RepID=A0A418XNI6_9PSED|nr:3-phosphoglycerate kinase [Pseudomonas cavernicola]RJG14033.1 3-phosphoglycerate kinase [Pseudomonas cavernicola]
MNRLICAVALLVPVTALATFFPIDVTPHMDGTDVAYETTPLLFNMGVMSLHNKGKTAAACKVVFNNGPEYPRVRKVILEPGEQATLAGNFKSEIIRMRIELTCVPV